MPDTPFKAMGREKRQDLFDVLFGRPMPGSLGEAMLSVECEKCGGRIYEGDWPWCGNQGPKGHRR